MGLRFDLKSANWVAHLLQPGDTIPALDEPWEETETLRVFLGKLKERFYSSSWHESDFIDTVNRAENLLSQVSTRERVTSSRLLGELRSFLSHRPWTALIVPSGHNTRDDRFLCEEEFLRFIINIRPDDPGLILQLEEPPEHGFSLLDVFPAFRTALAESNQWPGILIWRTGLTGGFRRNDSLWASGLTRGWKGGGDSVFLPFGSLGREEIRRKSHWIFSYLAGGRTDLELLKQRYTEEFPTVKASSKSNLHIIQISDLHIGSKEAELRIPRVQQFVRNLVEELSPSGEVVPLVCGDLMDSPKEKLVSATKSFVDFLANVGDKEPLVILGNHDVRKSGIVAKTYEKAIRLPFNNRVVWYDEAKIGIICLDSVRGGKLARGYVGEEQLLDLGNEIDRKKGLGDYSMLAALHHHPISVDIPTWYSRPFYERMLGGLFEKTDALVDAAEVMKFLRERKVTAVLHGHKHIPRLEWHQNLMAIVGCGSTVGKVPTTDKGTYMSVNVVSVDGQTGRVTSRLLAERAPGGGLREQMRHEVVLRT